MNYKDHAIKILVDKVEELSEDLFELGDCLSEDQIASLSDLRDEITLLIEPT